MSRLLLVGVFEKEDDILSVTRAAKDQGLSIVDVYAPYAVHGLERALGLKASKISVVCLLAGIAGAVLKLWFEVWASTFDWPVDVGGKPWNSLPAFVPMTFEVMVLFAGVATVTALFIATGLRPGRKPKAVVPGVTDDRFALVIEETDAAFDLPAVHRLLEEHNAVLIEERVEETEAP
ncbi:MAG: DUF3341 domain-containing protein [Bryobacterales bacterium]|nr:DUF3341 domain-containing protein [Bryobacterales bacterium]